MVDSASYSHIDSNTCQKEAQKKLLELKGPPKAKVKLEHPSPVAWVEKSGGEAEKHENFTLIWIRSCRISKKTGSNGADVLGELSKCI